MKPADNREEVLFREALGRAKGSEREAFLHQACAGDEALRGKLEALLQAHESADPPLEPQAAAPATETVLVPPEEGPGTVIGRYKILEKIGEGGFGVVYVAEQREPVKRRVALKIIKLGMDTRQVVARFEAERQALALMDHPNIAKVLDAGATETGRPFFVMELVKGIPITNYCDQEKLGTRERLDLFIKVCHAIQHAHQKGIIHRDIKPSNILVTLHDGVPVPKVIDFGIAKATQQELTEKTVYTQFQQFIGTPAYMSPEQAEMSGLDIERHLNHEPVLARPPSVGYRLQKSFRRNKLEFTAAGVVGLALVLGVVVSAWQAVRATRAGRHEAEARVQADQAARLADQAARVAQSQRERAEKEAQKAKASDLESRRSLYAAEMSLAYRAWQENSHGVALELLNQHRPAAGQPDLRGWEWRPC
jgi:tRNA A-37 threonylcarbamoyl transferase component Bud32